jgi:hypothetical protein
MPKHAKTPSNTKLGNFVFEVRVRVRVRVRVSVRVRVGVRV